MWNVSGFRLTLAAPSASYSHSNRIPTKRSTNTFPVGSGSRSGRRATTWPQTTVANSSEPQWWLLSSITTVLASNIISHSPLFLV
ncbi:hypothetical protein BDN71DRAFT_890949 [Pleurotus eryngii]|uniref:Uncharacterized protein n=1 Tax=Pleurotus eryngii TaxID=5323 RepID=A0A9P6D747_PLEER|nr:hypothetical protein BDN71DRAFT_890949 [Pleurotus eryngii]